MVDATDANENDQGESTDMETDTELQTQTHPTSLNKEFYHVDYMHASKFITTLTSIAHHHNHYPKIKLERRLHKQNKAWRVVTTVSCRTEVLDGLSMNDFHIAMLVDVEVGRDTVKCWLLEEEESDRKHI